jgi:hypothetical protein
MTDLRQIGLVVRKSTNTKGRTAYAVSRRDVFGDQFRLYA